jgi:hypothetical protein
MPEPMKIPPRFDAEATGVTRACVSGTAEKMA